MKTSSDRRSTDSRQAFNGDPARRAVTINRHLWRGLLAALALLIGALLIAMSDGAPAMAVGIALVYLSAISLVVAVFRRIGQGERRSLPSRSLPEERAVIREAERSLRQAISMRGKEGPGLSRG